MMSFFATVDIERLIGSSPAVASFSGVTEEHFWGRPRRTSASTVNELNRVPRHEGNAGSRSEQPAGARWMP